MRTLPLSRTRRALSSNTALAAVITVFTGLADGFRGAPTRTRFSTMRKGAPGPPRTTVRSGSDSSRASWHWMEISPCVMVTFPLSRMRPFSSTLRSLLDWRPG